MEVFRLAAYHLSWYPIQSNQKKKLPSDHVTLPSDHVLAFNELGSKIWAWAVNTTVHEAANEGKPVAHYDDDND